VAAVLVAATVRPVQAGAPGEASKEARFRHHAPITIEQPAAFVRLPLPVAAYAASRQAGLADLRVVDSRGERVPFAMLAPRAAQTQESESVRPADLYRLPAPRPGEREPASPLELQIVGDRITVKRLDRAVAVAGGSRSTPGGMDSSRPPGWLFDLGERKRDEPPPTLLRLGWASPAEFVAAYNLEVSDDLRQWRRAGGGQLLELQSPSGRLAQRDVKLPADGAPRFLRLRWADAANAPALAGAEQVRPRHKSVVLDAPTALTLNPVPEPQAPAGNERASSADPTPPALVYDLGAVLPVVEIDLQLAAAHRVAAVRVQGRSRADEPWRDLTQAVFYRIERGDTVDRPPPLALAAQVRWLRLVADPRSGALPPATPLAVQAQLASLVFAPQGTAPYRLLAGSADAAPGALPLATLVPALDAERARFGRAALGAFSEDEALAREEAWRRRVQSLRPAALWAVLLAGVAGLGLMVWRLARGEQREAGSGPGGVQGSS
jgi:hypothetical protein